MKLLPLDLCAPDSEMHEAAVKADNAFDGAGVDILVHNAGDALHCLLSRMHAMKMGLVSPGKT